MWGILNTLNNSEVEEVTIDATANWRVPRGMHVVKVSFFKKCCFFFFYFIPSTSNLLIHFVTNWKIHYIIRPEGPNSNFSQGKIQKLRFYNHKLVGERFAVENKNVILLSYWIKRSRDTDIK